jgi:hypothetical protein
MSRYVLSGALTLAFLWAIGCSEAPKVERDSSEAAIQTAQAAEAEQYASQTYQMALDTLNAAKTEQQKQDGKFSAFRRYGTAKHLFVTAQELAQRAADEAKTAKEQVRVETMALMNQADSALARAQVALDSAPKGKGSKADIAMIKADLGTIQQAYREAANEFSSGDYLTAKARLEVIISKADSLVVEIDTAKARKTTR